ncbi:ABC transporter substrate-binding protein [Intrasporangium oryzae NRRL B-24470]|uniref:ABC transporter substrate-binding protein n=1 Tax=Intrasporangium oryzae NRRL B-24470 TaxID=1386089 RepID=W9GC06_9MICO|nr:BMP family ABC transporter substrate-binding protein [Intrasporangium oryzae]EWT02762.1 ABC transporter substrate-binding protein [Intrasporangium oryzae NRRL B-24470]
MRHATKVAAVVAAAALGLAACSSNDTSGSSSTSAGGSSSAAAGKKIVVGIAYGVGGRGDQSFNASAAVGLDKAKADLGITYKEATQVNGESEAATEERLQQFVDAGATHVIGVGFAYAKAIGAVAKANPEVHFAIIDDASADSAGPNVAQLTFAEEQGSFLVGAAAALKSKTNTVGFVGGVATDLIKKFEAGYIAGAKAANPSIVVKSQYLSQPPDFSGFNDPAKGKTAAEGLYQGGADVVYHAAGGSGSGVFTAAKAAGKLAIGVDSDQALTATPDVRDVILTSMIKKVDVAVYDFLKSGSEGKDITGNKVYDLKAGGVDYATTGGKVDDIKAKLDDYKAKIISGQITVPTKP